MSQRKRQRRKKRERKPSFGGIRLRGRRPRLPRLPKIKPVKPGERVLVKGHIVTIEKEYYRSVAGIVKGPLGGISRERFAGDPTGLIIPVEFELHIDEGLEEVSDETVGQIQQDARVIIEGVGTAMENTARQIVPVRTGALRDSIEAEYYDVEGMALVARRLYAAYVEYGTSKMAAQPYLEPAIEEHQAMLQEQLDEMVFDRIEEGLAQRQEFLAERGDELELEVEWGRE